jgi:hypothetical protein
MECKSASTSMRNRINMQSFVRSKLASILQLALLLGNT